MPRRAPSGVLVALIVARALDSALDADRALP
jgi:hypothetical protein